MDEQNNNQAQEQNQAPQQPQAAPQMSAALGAVGSSLKHNINAFRNDRSVSIWIKLMRVLAWIMLAGGIIGGLVVAINAARITVWFGPPSFSAGTFFSLWLGSWFATIMAFAGIMIFCDMARDVAQIKENTRN